MHIQRLTDPEFKPQLEAFRLRLKNEPGFARKMLQDAGILDKEGNLAKSYGGYAKFPDNDSNLQLDFFS